MGIEWENGFVKRISVEGLTGAGWGISVQDVGSWFTLDGAAGCTVTDRGCTSLSNGFRRVFELAMAYGQWSLTVEATSWRGTITIRQRLQSLAPSRLVGMAIDLHFDPNSFDRALIGSHDMASGDPAMWHHGPADITLAGVRGMAWIRTCAGSDRTTQLVGIRSEPEGWTIHTECSACRAAHDEQKTFQPGDVLDLSVECELWAAKPEMVTGRPGTLQLA